jgi:hypothetical protein
MLFYPIVVLITRVCKLKQPGEGVLGEDCLCCDTAEGEHGQSAVLDLAARGERDRSVTVSTS